MSDAAYLDLADPTFDVTSAAVHEARERDWYARTPYGWAVLRYEEGTAVLKDRRFQQGNARWPAQNGVHEGPFVQWWRETLLSLEGEDHLRLRRLLGPAFRSRAIEAMRPQFQQLGAASSSTGSRRAVGCEFIGEFAEPYAARVLCLLLGLPESEWAQVAHWADDLGKSFGINLRQDLPRIEAALAGLTGYVEEVVADRRVHPRDDLVSTLVTAQDRRGAQRARAERRPGVPGLRRDGDDAQPARSGAADLPAAPRPVGAAGGAARARRAAVEEVMRVNPTVTWVTREATRGRRPVRSPDPGGRDRPGPVARLGHRPAGDGRRPVFDITAPTGRCTAGSAAACTTASGTSSPAPT